MDLPGLPPSPQAGLPVGRGATPDPGLPSGHPRSDRLSVAGRRSASARRALTSTGEDHWRSPAAVVELASDVLRLPLTWDLASSGRAAAGLPVGQYLGPGSPHAADTLALRPIDVAILCRSGIAGAAWLNPPYSKAGGGLERWHRLAFRVGELGVPVAVLCPPHPGRRWWWEWARRAAGARVLTSRLAFIDPESGRPLRGNTQDSALFFYGIPRMEPYLAWLNAT